jgi:hypothetical protein
MKAEIIYCLIDEEGLDEKVREQIEKSARHLFGMIHARFVITSRGLMKMVIGKASNIVLVILNSFVIIAGQV